MGFFDDDDGERESEQGAEREQSLARLRAGGIPLEAETRLRDLGDAGSLFTSGLSVKEFALLGALQIRPLAQVMGASVVQVAPQLLPALAPRVVREDGKRRFEEPTRWQRARYGWEEQIVCDLAQQVAAWKLARRRAFRRLRDEALAVGADLVVGVRLERAALDLGDHTIDLVVTGTAARGAQPRKEEEAPVLSDLSVQEYWRTYSAGFEPVGLMLATSVVFASPARSTRWQRARAPRQNWQVQELAQGFQQARDRVREQLREAVSDSGGQGMVGVQLSHTVREGEFEHWASVSKGKPRGWQRGSFGIPYYFSGAGEASRSGHVITMHGAGTALRRRQDHRHSTPPVTMAMRAS